MGFSQERSLNDIYRQRMHYRSKIVNKKDQENDIYQMQSREYKTYTQIQGQYILL